MKYRTKEGDVLDAICHKHYGDAPWQLADILNANPGLAAYGPVLPSALIIELPDIQQSATPRPTIRLWS